MLGFSFLSKFCSSLFDSLSPIGWAVLGVARVLGVVPQMCFSSFSLDAELFGIRKGDAPVDVGLFHLLTGVFIVEGLLKSSVVWLRNGSGEDDAGLFQTFFVFRLSDVVEWLLSMFTFESDLVPRAKFWLEGLFFFTTVFFTTAGVDAWLLLFWCRSASFPRSKGSEGLFCFTTFFTTFLVITLLCFTSCWEMSVPP